MSRSPDVERGAEYKPLPNDEEAAESETLLGTRDQDLADSQPRQSCLVQKRFGGWHLGLAFLGGVLASACLSALFPSLCAPFSRATTSASSSDSVNIAAPPYVGSTERHNYPPTSPTNADTSLFPTNVGYAGATPTGAEPAVIATAPSYPVHTGAPVLVAPETKGGAKGSSKDGFDVFKYWGNLSPWYSIKRGTFGVDSSPEAPEQCAVTGLHFLHRHGARYPTAWGKQVSVRDIAFFLTSPPASFGGPAAFAKRLHESAEGWDGTGDLDFMNHWYVVVRMRLMFRLRPISSGPTSWVKKVNTCSNIIQIYPTKMSISLDAIRKAAVV